MTEPITKRDLRVALVLGLILAVLGSMRLINVCGTHHDDAILVANAKALATGQGYRSINLPGSPPHTKYPFLYPAVLAPIWALLAEFPQNLIWIQAVSLLSGALTLSLCYLYLVHFRYASRTAASLALLTCGTTAVMMYYTGLAMSEMPFAVASVLALWVVERRLVSSPTVWREDVARGLVLSLPFLTRSVGLSITAASLAILLLRRRASPALFGGAAFGCGLWLSWVIANGAFAHTNPVGIYDADYVGWWINSVSAGFLRIVGWNVLWMILGLPAFAWVGVTKHVATGPAQALFYLATAPFWLLALWTLLRSGRPLGLVLTAYLALVILWPWPPFRFLVPILPLVVGVWYQYLWSLGPVHRFRWIQLSVGGLFGAVIGLNAAASSDILLAMRDPRLGEWSPLPASEVSESSYRDIFEWIRTNTPETAVLASNFDPMIYLYTGRQTAQPFSRNGVNIYYQKIPSIGDVRELVRVFVSQRVEYFVLVPALEKAHDQAVALIVTDLKKQAPECLRRAYLGFDPRFEVFAVNLSACERDVPQ